MLLLLLLLFFEPLSFTAALGKHNLDCRTSLMDGEQKDGLLDSFLIFGSDFLFFPSHVMQISSLQRMSH